MADRQPRTINHGAISLFNGLNVIHVHENAFVDLQKAILLFQLVEEFPKCHSHTQRFAVKHPNNQIMSFCINADNLIVRDSEFLCAGFDSQGLNLRHHPDRIVQDVLNLTVEVVFHDIGKGVHRKSYKPVAKFYVEQLTLF